MNGYALVATIVPSVVLFVATVRDIRTRRIPNRLTYTFIVLGCARHVFAAGLPLPIDAFVERFADLPVIASSPSARNLLTPAVSLLLACSLLGAARATGPDKLGGGDAKLIFGLALWTGPIQLWRTIAIAVVVTFGWLGIRTRRPAGRETTDQHRPHVRAGREVTDQHRPHGNGAFRWVRAWMRAGREATDQHRPHGNGVPFAPFLLIGHVAAAMLQSWGQK